jgi:hypothetical protein
LLGDQKSLVYTHSEFEILKGVRKRRKNNLHYLIIFSDTSSLHYADSTTIAKGICTKILKLVHLLDYFGANNSTINCAMLENQALGV